MVEAVAAAAPSGRALPISTPLTVEFHPGED
jgi:hypothetical protein